ncbi:MFS transporter [Frondihabitans sp. PhB188]|uniref:MFS transporter n=1 Tax=Frondihabitans sp. PhB188 TaxID=2485200 RepID=UPI000F47A1C9|nr:MFS transporter [Frondihabitans sp. PhB188]ROQ37317.1 MFS transporter [Frondihabitans sp. PhB188]
MPRIATRLRRPFADPVVRVLATATLVSTLGRGAFFTLTALYFTLIVGLSATQVALILTVASAVGVGTSLLGGHLSDRLSARRLLFALVVAQGLALLSYAFVTSFGAVLVVACIVNGVQAAANATRSAVIARAFTGRARVTTRALLRTVTNIGIAVGSAAAGVPLLIGTGTAFRTAIVLAACATLASSLPLLRLPVRVNASPAIATADSAGGRSPFRDPAYLAITALSGLFGIQFALAEVGLPLWIVHDTEAPVILVSVILIVNTVLVIALQIPLARRTDTIARSGRAVGIAGALMLGACVAYGTSGRTGAIVAGGLLVVGMLFHTFAEILSSAGAWNLGFELADPTRAGAYQGVFSMGFSLGSLFGPLIVAATALAHGFAGWMVLAAVFVVAAGGVVAVVRTRVRAAVPAA